MENITSQSNSQDVDITQDTTCGSAEKETRPLNNLTDDVSRSTSSTEVPIRQGQAVSAGSMDVEKTATAPNEVDSNARGYQYPNDLVDFDGPDDTDNPKNFSKRKKWAITVSMGWMTFVVTFASSIFSVAIDSVSKEYHISRVVATLGVSLFLLVRSSF